MKKIIIISLSILLLVGSAYFIVNFLKVKEEKQLFNKSLDELFKLEEKEFDEILIIEDKYSIDIEKDDFENFEKTIKIKENYLNSYQKVLDKYNDKKDSLYNYYKKDLTLMHVNDLLNSKIKSQETTMNQYHKASKNSGENLLKILKAKS